MKKSSKQRKNWRRNQYPEKMMRNLIRDANEYERLKSEGKEEY